MNYFVHDPIEDPTVFREPRKAEELSFGQNLKPERPKGLMQCPSCSGRKTGVAFRNPLLFYLFG